MKAQATDYILLEYFYRYENHWYASTDHWYASTECLDYDAWKKLPAVIVADKILLGKTGWNSDTGRAYYRSDVKVGKPIF